MENHSCDCQFAQMFSWRLPRHFSADVVSVWSLPEKNMKLFNYSIFSSFDMVRKTYLINFSET